MKEIVTDNYTLKSNAYVNWSGGKDSALALYKLMQSNQYDIKISYSQLTPATH